MKVSLDNVPTVPLLLERARQSASTCRHQSFQLLQVRKALTCSRASVITLERRLEERALTGDLASIAVDLQYLQTKDKLNGKAVAIKFVKDLVHQMRLGKSSRNMRWAESSKRLMAVLKKWGGPRSLRLLRENVGGASDRTVGRTWTAKIFRYPLGEHECIVMHVVEVLAPQVEALKLGPDELLACQISQDETPVIADLSYSQRDDGVVGSCGRRSADHTCECEEEALGLLNDRFVAVLGDDNSTADKIDALCDEYVRASYLRLAILKPLSKRVQPVILSMRPSCNRFRTVHVQMQWVKFEGLLAVPLRKLKLYVSSHGTDGDGRYFAAQKVNMTGDPTWASGNATSHWAIFPNGAIEFRIDHEGFTLRALLLDDGRVINIEFQDSRHVIKKLASWLFVNKQLRRGSDIGTADHLLLVFERFEMSSHHFTRRQIYRHDRQDTAGPVRLSCDGARECLQQMQSTHKDKDGASSTRQSTLRPPLTCSSSSRL